MGVFVNNYIYSLHSFSKLIIQKLIITKTSKQTNERN